jgi:mRNA-degrading endonuclease toxin of MazEF toxin-antitoxin module
VHKREIWWCSLGINIGDEEDGKNDMYERPVLVLKVFNQKAVLVVPLTTQVKENIYYFSFVHEGVSFAAMLSQVRLISTNRFSRKIRKIEPDVFVQIKESMKKVLL